MPTIIFNGKSYNNLEEMPANERQAYEKMSDLFADKNGNGIPDLLEGDMVQNVLSAYSSAAKINVDGKNYQTLDDLPPEMRQKVDKAFQTLSKMGVLTNATDTNPQAPAAFTDFGGSIEPQPFNPPQGSSVIEEDRGSNVFSLVLGGIVLCFTIGVLTFAVFFFLNR